MISASLPLCAIEDKGTKSQGNQEDLTHKLIDTSKNLTETKDFASILDLLQGGANPETIISGDSTAREKIVSAAQGHEDLTHKLITASKNLTETKDFASILELLLNGANPDAITSDNSTARELIVSAAHKQLGITTPATPVTPKPTNISPTNSSDDLSRGTTSMQGYCFASYCAMHQEGIQKFRSNVDLFHKQKEEKQTIVDNKKLCQQILALLS